MDLKDRLTIALACMGLLVSILMMRWHVRTQRQIALFNKDKAADVKPPDSWLLRTTKAYWDLELCLFFYAIPTIALAIDGNSGEPVTRSVVYRMVSCGLMSVTILVSFCMWKLNDSILSVASMPVKIVETMVEVARLQKPAP